MKITIEFIPHRDQRYPTVGDWFLTPSKDLMIRISHQYDIRHAYLIALHELTEFIICQTDGVSQKSVDAFDMTWRPYTTAAGVDITEPGDDPRAPYHEQHVIAEIVERIVAQALAVHWPSYSLGVDRVMLLGETSNPFIDPPPRMP